MKKQPIAQLKQPTVQPKECIDPLSAFNDPNKGLAYFPKQETDTLPSFKMTFKAFLEKCEAAPQNIQKEFSDLAWQVCKFYKKAPLQLYQAFESNWGVTEEIADKFLLLGPGTKLEDFNCVGWALGVREWIDTSCTLLDPENKNSVVVESAISEGNVELNIFCNIAFQRMCNYFDVIKAYVLHILKIDIAKEPNHPTVSKLQKCTTALQTYRDNNKVVIPEENGSMPEKKIISQQPEYTTDGTIAFYFNHNGNWTHCSRYTKLIKNGQDTYEIGRWTSKDGSGILFAHDFADLNHGSIVPDTKPGDNQGTGPAPGVGSVYGNIIIVA